MKTIILLSTVAALALYTAVSLIKTTIHNDDLAVYDQSTIFKGDAFQNEVRKVILDILPRLN